VQVRTPKSTIERYTGGKPLSNDRNPGMPLDMEWVLRTRVNKSGLDRRAAEIGARRSVKKQWQAAWLLKAVTNVDLTTLAGDDTPGNVQRLCAKAKNPIRKDILEMLGAQDLPIKCGAVCVYPSRVKDAVGFLKGSGIPVASVATGFPSGQIKHEHKLEEIRQCVEDGAEEIDIVINRQAVLCGDWETLYKETQDFREACGDAHMKSILAVGELSTMTNIHRASLVTMMAGSDFIKTSTGKEPTNATIPVSLVMLRALREYMQTTNYKVGFKPAGGIQTTKQVLQYQAMMKDELGDEWLENDLFRIGASSLVTDIERQLYHQATGQYAAAYYMPMG
jgi:deoxyribose-phosphate aldolase